MIRAVESEAFFSFEYLLRKRFSGWRLTWKTWKSQGIPKWSGKKVRWSEIRCVFSSSKYSKTRFSAGAPPRGPRWGSLRRSPTPSAGDRDTPSPSPAVTTPTVK